jgi:hypothetical protein
MSMLNPTAPAVHQNPDLDSTTYIYHFAGQDIPLADFFLNFRQLSSNNNLETSKNSTNHKVKSSVDNSEGNHVFSFQYTDFVLVVLIFLFSILAYIRFYGKNYYSRVSTSIFNYSYSTSFFKEKNLAFILNNNLLLFVFYISSAMLVGQIEDYFSLVGPHIGKWIQFFANLCIILVLIVSYKIAYRICGMLFNQYRTVSDYLFYFGNLLKITGIFYLIMLVGAFFSNESWKFIFIYLTIFVTILVGLIKIWRLLSILFSNRFSLYYLILYFCALEIVPVMLLFKILISISRNNLLFFNKLV